MKSRTNLYIIIVFFINWAQLIYPQVFAPLKLGNFWIWQTEEGNLVKSTVIDTNYSINNHFYSNISNGGNLTYPDYLDRFRIEDSMYCRYAPGATKNDKEVPYYKYNAALGDTWSYPLGGTARATCQILAVYPMNVFNISVNIKQLSTDDAGLGGSMNFWTDEFGLLKGIEGEVGYAYFTLKACRINGIIYGDTSMTVGVKNEINSSYNFILYQNYPNPFNPSTNIDFEIKEYSLVTLKVYNILGNVVADLINEEKIPGRYSTRFNGNKLSSGVYFYKLIIGGKTQVKKMILMK